MPPADVLRLVVNGEIYSACKFEYDNLFIEWFIDLPYDWSTTDIRTLSGVTHTCCTRTEGRDDVAYFSFPFSLDLFYKLSAHRDKSTDAELQWPRMFFEVVSFDMWQRYRAEGYGCLTLPNHPGSTMHEVLTWRPAGDSVISELRRFFIGGSPELEDPTFVSRPVSHDGSYLSKFGFRSITSGVVNIRTNTILQSRAFLHGLTSKKKLASVIDKIGFSVIQSNIVNILEAFQRAKHRMISARENLKKDFIDTMRAYAIDDTDA